MLYSHEKTMINLNFLQKSCKMPPKKQSEPFSEAEHKEFTRWYLANEDALEQLEIKQQVSQPDNLSGTGQPGQGVMKSGGGGGVTKSGGGVGGVTKSGSGGGVSKFDGGGGVTKLCGGGGVTNSGGGRGVTNSGGDGQPGGSRS